jgi:nucleoside-diphosphate-sugar epimerase
MRVLVLGAGGYVGRAVVKALSATDWAVPVAGLRRATGKSDVETLVVDGTDEAALEKVLTGVDAVVNCVVGGPETIVKNAEALFAAAKKNGTHVVYLSSMAVYGSAVGPVTEDAPLLGDVGGYSEAKVQAEKLAAGSNASILRCGCIYGGGSPQWTTRIAKLLQEHRVGDLGAAGDGYTNLVHIQDVVAVILAVLKQGRTGVKAYNVAMPDAPTWNTYFIRFAKALGAVPVSRITARQLKLETKLLVVPLKLMEKAGSSMLPPAITPPMLRLWGQDIRLISALASTELTISWTSLEDGISEATAGLSSPRSRSRAVR